MDLNDKMEKSMLLARLDKATTTAASILANSTLLSTTSRKSTIVGKVCVIKNLSGSYDILSLDKRYKIHENISLFDIAMIIAQKHNIGDTYSIEKLLFLENRFIKHYNDMKHYLHCMRGTTRNKDFKRLAILEDKFQVSESHAKNIRDNISNFKILK
jgi:hypothetical protein